MENYEILAGNRICAIYENGELRITDEQFAPLFLTDFKAWVESRAVSEQRGFTARRLKSISGLSALASAYETSLKAHCACVTDNYWVREKDSSLTYDDVNCESYKGELAQLALGIESDPSKFRITSTHPELTNVGNSDKAWVVEKDGTRWLYKKQEIKECYREVLASKIATRLGIATAEYEFIGIKDDQFHGFVRSKDFTQNKGVNLEHIEFVLKHYKTDEDDFAGNVEIFRRFDCEKEYMDIKYLDILTGNNDRHPRNYGLLRSRETGGVVGLAPNYDNNFAFKADLSMRNFTQFAIEMDYQVPELTDEDIGELVEEMKVIAPKYDVERDLQTLFWKQKSVIESIEKLRAADEEDRATTAIDMREVRAAQGDIWVSPHFRKGKPVKGHWRRRRR